MLHNGRSVPCVPVDPIASSERTGWKGIQLERHRTQPVEELSGIVDGYQVCLFLSDAVPISWKSNGRCFSRVVGKRELCTATHGELRTVSWSNSFDVLVFSIAPAIMRKFSAECGRGRTVEISKQRGLRDEHLEALLRTLYADVVAGTPAGPLYGEQLGAALAVYLCGRFSAEGRGHKAYRSELPGHALRRVIDYMEERLGDQITLDELASQASISRFHFSRLFRNSTGESPSRFLVGRRVERAKQHLAKPVGTFTEIAQTTGFSSQSHLISVFRSRTGVTPAQYRRLLTDRDG